MIQGIIIWLLTLVTSYVLIGFIGQSNPRLNRRFMVFLFFYHSLLALVYYLYAISNPSDSFGYYYKATVHSLGDRWFDYFGISTKFVDFIAFFLVNRLGFTYEASMAFFSWLGFLGFLGFYIFFRERIVTKPKLFGYDALIILFALPNLHFWSSSLGKGSLIFFGFGLFFFAVNKPAPRFWALLFGGWIIFQLRPHIFYVILIAIAIGYTFSTRGVAPVVRVMILGASVFLLYFIYEDILTLTGLEEDSIFDPLISHRASELGKATSGIDIASYNIWEKLFAFWFRPLFIDSPGTLGLIVSFENLFYLIFFARLLTPSGVRYLWSADAIIKTCFLTFIGVSFALAQISGNLGIAMRQKSQVMILMLFVILKFMDNNNIAWQQRELRLRELRKKNVLTGKLARL